MELVYETMAGMGVAGGDLIGGFRLREPLGR